MSHGDGGMDCPHFCSFFGHPYAQWVVLPQSYHAQFSPIFALTIPNYLLITFSLSSFSSFQKRHPHAPSPCPTPVPQPPHPYPVQNEVCGLHGAKCILHSPPSHPPPVSTCYHLSPLRHSPLPPSLPSPASMCVCPIVSVFLYIFGTPRRTVGEG